MTDRLKYFGIIRRMKRKHGKIRLYTEGKVRL